MADSEETILEGLGESQLIPKSARSEASTATKKTDSNPASQIRNDKFTNHFTNYDQYRQLKHEYNLLKSLNKELENKIEDVELEMEQKLDEAQLRHGNLMERANREKHRQIDEYVSELDDMKRQLANIREQLQNEQEESQRLQRECTYLSETLRDARTSLSECRHRLTELYGQLKLAEEQSVLDHEASVLAICKLLESRPEHRDESSPENRDELHAEHQDESLESSIRQLRNAFNEDECGFDGIDEPHMISGRNQVNEPHDDDRTSLMAELDIFNDKIMQVDMQGNQELVSKINQLLRNILLHKPQLLEGVLIQIMKHLYDYIFNNDPSLLERR